MLAENFFVSSWRNLGIGAEKRGIKVNRHVPYLTALAERFSNVRGLCLARLNARLIVGAVTRPTNGVASRSLRK